MKLMFDFCKTEMVQNNEFNKVKPKPLIFRCKYPDWQNIYIRI